MTEALSVDELRALSGELGLKVRSDRLSFLAGPNATSLHQFRVSVRSARSLLVLTRDSFVGEELNIARHSGSKLSYLTGRARNLDVFAESWRDLTMEIESDIVMNLSAVLDQINASRSIEYRNVIDFLATDEATTFENELVRLVECERTNDSADEIVKKAIRRMNRRVRTIAESLSDRAADEVLHQARKDLKKLRYSLEMTRSHFPGRQLEKAMNTIGDLQTTIGRHQDAVMFTSELWSCGHRLAAQGASAEILVSVGILMAPIDEVRRQARRRSLARLRSFIEDDSQQQLKKLLGSLE